VELNSLDLNKLHVFVVAAQLSSFSLAAKRLGLSRSAISQAIAALEAALGIALFDRVGRGVVLTELGRTLLARVLAYQTGLASVLAELGQRSTRPKGSARLGLFIGFSKARLTDFLAAFLGEFPDVNVKVLFLPHAELAARLLERKLDVALSLHPLSREARVLGSVPLFEEELLLVSGRKHHLVQPKLSQIRELPIVDYYERGELTRAWIRHHFRTDPGALRIRAHAAAVDFVLELIQKDVGVGVVPRHVAAPLLARGALRQIRSKRRELADTIWLNQIRDFRHEAAAAHFIDGLSKAFATSDWRAR
jgi:DNA-binding transcriptional LysR family regulator